MNKALIAFRIFLILAGVGFWAALIYVAAHFVFKYW